MPEILLELRVKMAHKQLNPSELYAKIAVLKGLAVTRVRAGRRMIS